MTRSGQQDALCSQAALYCLDMLRDEALIDFRQHLEGCLACRTEVAESLPAVTALGLAVDPEAPPAGLKQRVMARLAESVAGDGTDPRVRPDPPTIVPSDDGSDGSWEPTDVPGASTRKLFSDETTGRSTYLVRMEAGTCFPRHRHVGFEECFVLEGSVRVGDQLMLAGDYQRSEDGTVHAEHSTDDGCLLLIMAGSTVAA